MAEKTNTPPTVKYYQLTPAAYEAAINTLTTLPFNQVNSILISIAQGVTAIMNEDESGKKEAE